ncbi:MAG TPA: hypothetical protein VLG13_00540 [Patescibacteria group bacterium]|nr:hypothetical protein [Patescibacteria group bacterium]
MFDNKNMDIENTEGSRRVNLIVDDIGEQGVIISALPQPNFLFRGLRMAQKIGMGISASAEDYPVSYEMSRLELRMLGRRLGREALRHGPFSQQADFAAKIGEFFNPAIR